MLPIETTVVEFVDRDGRSTFGRWFDELDAMAAVKIGTALVRLEQGNSSNVKGVGGGIFETKIDFGPGYRIYFGKDGDRIVILLGGGTKKRQDRDILNAKLAWSEYKAMKKEQR
jgi:putative addiction module killer protein